MEFKTLNETDFRKDVLSSNKTVCLVFGANWSGSFYLVQPTLREFIKRSDGKIETMMLDYDSNKWLAEKSGIYFHVPSILIYRDGKKVDQAIGLIACLDLLIELQKDSRASVSGGATGKSSE